MIKKIAVLLSLMILLVSFAACKAEQTNEDSNSGITSVSSVADSTESKAEEIESSNTVSSSNAVSSLQSNPTVSSKPQETISKPQETTSKPEKPNFQISRLFGDGCFDGGNAMALSDTDSNGLTAKRIIARSSYEIFHSYVYDNLDGVAKRDLEYVIGNTTHILKQFAVPSETVFSIANKFFIIDDSVKTTMKKSELYDAATDKFWTYPPDFWFTGIDATLIGYKDLGSGKYTLYVKAREMNHIGPCSICGANNSCVVSTPCFKMDIKADAAAERGYYILSFEYVDSIPDNIVKPTVAP